MTELVLFPGESTPIYDATRRALGDPFARLPYHQGYLETWCSLWYTHEPASTRPVPDYEYLERLQELAIASMPAPSLLVDPVAYEWTDKTAELLSPVRQALAAVKEPLELEAGR